MTELSEQQRRVLQRIVQQMRDGATGEVTLRLHEGGVRDYRESRSIRPKDMDESDGVLARELEAG